VKLFLSHRPDEVKATTLHDIKQYLKAYNIESVVVEGVDKNRPPEIVRSKIFACDGLLAIITSSQRDWIQNEIGIAYAAGKDHIYGLASKAAGNIGGLLPIIKPYGQFDEDDRLKLKMEVSKIATVLLNGAANVGIVEPTRMLCSTVKAGTPFGRPFEEPVEWANRVEIALAFKPPRLPFGDFSITIYFPEGFGLDTVSRDPDNQVVTELPPEACRITAGLTSEKYPRQPYIKAHLNFSGRSQSIIGDWVVLKVRDVVAPTISGKYEIFGEGEVSTGFSLNRVHESTSHFRFEPIIAGGETSTLTLSGTICGPNGERLEESGLIWAQGHAADPYTRKPTGRPVRAAGTFSPYQHGQYEITGLAPGTYDIYARVGDGQDYTIGRSVAIYESKILNGSLSSTRQAA